MFDALGLAYCHLRHEPGKNLLAGAFNHPIGWMLSKLGWWLDKILAV